MRRAIYYPHTTLRSTSVVKSALLMWDNLDFIAPWVNFEATYDDPEIARAMELIGRAHVPTERQKKETDTRVSEMIEKGVPPEFRLRAPKTTTRYEMYPEKLLPETWHNLRRASMTGKLRANGDYHLMEPAGLTVMSILADCCAGSTKARVTDRGDAYANLSSLFVDRDFKDTLHGQVGEGLVPFSLQIADIDRLTVRELIEFREREEKERGHTLRDLRHRYTDNIEKYLARIMSASTPNDVDEIRHQYIDDMRIDLGQLKAELGFAKRDVIFSKEAVTTLIGGAALVAAIVGHMPLQLPTVLGTGGLAFGLGGLFAVGNKYASARRAVMQKHPMAYMYELHG